MWVFPGRVTTSYIPNLGNPPTAAPQPTLGVRFNLASNATVSNTVVPDAVAPLAGPTFLEQLGHSHNPQSNLIASSSAPQYVVRPPANFQTPTPIRTMPYQSAPTYSAPTYSAPSYYPQNPPIPQPPCGAIRGVATKTPSRKNMHANRVDFFAEQRKFRGRKKKGVQSAAHSPSAGEEDEPSGSGTNVVDALAAGVNYDDAKPIIRKALFFEMVATEPWPLQVGPTRQAVLEFLRTTPGGSKLADIAADDPQFDRNLRSTMANVRGDAYMYCHAIIKHTYDVSPRSKDRLNHLLEDKQFHFLYPKETKVSSKEIGLCCHRAVSTVVCAILFDCPAGLATLYMDRLCAFDKPESWHDERKDKSDDARRGVPIGLIAFAGTLIYHVLECVRDDVPGAKQKSHKFESSRYKKTWVRIRERLVKYKFLGQLRAGLLQSVKARYNEVNNLAGSSSSSSNSSSDSEDGADSGMVPEDGTSGDENGDEMEHD